VLPLYSAADAVSPLILWLMKWRGDVTLALSALLYALTWPTTVSVAYPIRFWAFNRLLAVLSCRRWARWRALRMCVRRLRMTLWICVA